MMPALLAIWRQPVLQMRNRSTRGVSWMLLALFGLGWFTLKSHIPHREVLFAFCTGIPMAMLLVMWWIYLLGNVAIQCHSAALQLVPQLRVRITRAVVGAWLAIVAIETLLVGVPTGYPGQVAVATGLVLIEVGIMGSLWRFAAIGFACWLMRFASVPFTASLVAFVQTPAALCVGAVLLLLDGWAALRRLGRLRGAIPGQRVAAAPRQPRNAARERGADRQPLFLRPLGRSHFDRHGQSLGVAAVVCVLLRLWCAWGGHDPHAILAGARDVVAVILLYTLADTAAREARRFETSRTEQALLCLAPGAPASADVNRVLARGFVAGFARSWLRLALASLALVAVLGAQAGELARFALVWPLALVLVAMPLRDFARAHAAPRWPPVVFTAVVSVIFNVASNGGAALDQWMAGSAAVAAAGIAVVAWRWRALLAAPPALPAGRMA